MGLAHLVTYQASNVPLSLNIGTLAVRFEHEL